MNNSIDMTFVQLFNIFTDGASYIPEEKKYDNFSLESIQRQLNQLLSGKNTVYDWIVSNAKLSRGVSYVSFYELFLELQFHGLIPRFSR